MHDIADAIRDVTAKLVKDLDERRRRSHFDAHDLVEILLAIADRIDPPLDPEVQTPTRPLTRFYVATLSTFVLIDALDEPDAVDKGEAALKKLLNRPVRIRVVRPATPEEIEIQFLADANEAAERR